MERKVNDLRRNLDRSRKVIKNSAACPVAEKSRCFEKKSGCSEETSAKKRHKDKGLEQFDHRSQSEEKKERSGWEQHTYRQLKPSQREKVQKVRGFGEERRLQKTSKPKKMALWVGEKSA